MVLVAISLLATAKYTLFPACQPHAAVLDLVSLLKISVQWLKPKAEGRQSRTHYLCLSPFPGFSSGLVEQDLEPCNCGQQKSELNLSLSSQSFESSSIMFLASRT